MITPTRPSFRIVGVCLLGLGAVSVWANPAPTPTPLPEGLTAYGAYLGNDKPGGYFHWTAEAWTGDETPFLVLRKRIDGQFKTGTNLIGLLDSYRNTAKQQPFDAKAQFAWAYAAYLSRVYHKEGRDPKEIVKGVREGLERPTSPKSAEYARMRAFFHLWDEKWRLNSMHFVKNAVFRLVKLNPQDYDLKYAFAYEFAHSKDTNPIALQWAQEYRRAYPRKAVGGFLLGRVHESRFGLYLSEKEGKRAIGYFNEFLAVASKKSTFRKTAQWHINDIKRLTQRFRARGWLKS